MKKKNALLAILAAVMMVSSLGVRADEASYRQAVAQSEATAQTETTASAQDDLGDPVSNGSICVENKSPAGAWITIYNGFGSIRDAGGVDSGKRRCWDGYYGPIDFRVRIEVGGVMDTAKWVSMMKGPHNILLDENFQMKVVN